MYRASTPFVVYLVRSGVLSHEALLHVMEVQHRQRQPFGSIALRARKLTVKQTAQVLHHQISHPDTRFGEIAVEMGFITKDDIEEILRLQRDAVRPLEEIVIKECFMTREEMSILRQRYADEMVTGPQAASV